MRRIAVLAVVFGALLYGVHRLAMVAVARLIGNQDMIVGLDCCIDYHRDAPDPWGNVLVAVSGVVATQVVAWVAIGLLAARRGGPPRVLATLAGTAFVISPLLQLIVYAVWHWAERDYVAVIDYLMDATGLPEMALMAAMLGLFAGYALIFWLGVRAAWDRATAVPAPVAPSS
ncbi:hypothetical protein HCN51_38425 [Nonomuraea sp. FMUSA5-5]|uniref:Uncharacterized protein n=1 Tax=Nonomuraea composti TaxID=2720023 RepID=A0ABX1BBU7_9ACTN|nr:hypothetical protein [Nonomuraea sp. FMUSA5-5]NJP95250.1 hypothetical protein [Nonomuraea sp. FMUSA5-5]